MSYHKIKLQQDVINILGRQIEPVSINDLIHQVTNEGYKSQRLYTDDEILDTLSILVDTGFVDHVNDKYQWRE